MNLLITGAWSHSEDQLNTIRSMGHHVILMQQEKDDLPCSADEIEGVICNGLFLYHDIGSFRSLRYIQLTSAGYDRVPLDYVGSHDIKLHNARGVYSVPMAECVVGGVLQLYKQSRFFYENQKDKKWEKHRGLLELNGKTVLIVGCGSVGTECAKRFGAFGCKVIGIDVAPYENGSFSEMMDYRMLDDALAASDVTVLTLPLTAQTKDLFNAARLSRMKDGAVLVNVSRGSIVNEKALADALEKNLFGAVIDVFEEEPLDESSILWTKKNIIITPHNSFVSDGNAIRFFDVIVENLEKSR